MANGVVYVSTSMYDYAAFDAANGTLLWSQVINNGNTNASSPTVANGVVYVTAGKLWALDPATGAVLWSATPPNNGNATGDPTIANGIVYVGSDRKQLLAYHLPG